MSALSTKLNLSNKGNQMSNFKLYLYTVDGEAVTSMIHVDDVEEFLLEHPDAVLTNRR
jgi:hypothetical protein